MMKDHYVYDAMNHPHLQKLDGFGATISRAPRLSPARAAALAAAKAKARAAAALRVPAPQTRVAVESGGQATPTAGGGMLAQLSDWIGENQGAALGVAGGLAVLLVVMRRRKKK
jgi:hypothetical protein